MKVLKNSLLNVVFVFSSFLISNLLISNMLYSKEKQESKIVILHKDDKKYKEISKSTEDALDKFSSAAKNEASNQQFENILFDLTDKDLLSRRICGVADEEIAKRAIKIYVKMLKIKTVQDLLKSDHKLKIVKVEERISSRKGQGTTIVTCELTAGDNQISILVLYFSLNGQLFNIKIEGVSPFTSIESQIRPKLSGKSKEERIKIARKELQDILEKNTTSNSLAEK